MLRLRSCQIENFRALRHSAMEFDETTVVVGENGCGKSSLLGALEICLGTQAPAGRFDFGTEDFHRGPNGPTGPIRIRLAFAEDAGREGEPLWASLRLPGLVDEEGRLRFSLTVKANLGPGGVAVEYLFPKGAEIEDPPALLAEVRRVLPFLRIRDRGFVSDPDPEVERALSGDELAREKVQRQVRSSFAQLVEADVVKESAVATARDAVEEILSRWAMGAEPESSGDHESRVMAPFSSSGTWAQMATLLHGSGAQSLAMLAFAGAFLAARGPRTMDSDARPLVSVEEPEARLHPLMLTSVWSLIQKLPAQKIITTNSADLLAAIPLSSLRRLVRDTEGRAVAYRVPAGGMNLDELRRVAYHLRIRRGSALFMKFWLLVEGETEFWLIPEIARALGIDLRQEGVECLEFAHSGLTPLVRLADFLGIGWHLLSDGDRAGQNYYQQAAQLARAAHSRVTVLTAHDIEHCLWENGYSHVFLHAAGFSKGISPRIKPQVVIDKAIKSCSKPELALLMGEAMRASRSPGVPEPLERMVRGAAHWAAHGTFEPVAAPASRLS